MHEPTTAQDFAANVAPRRSPTIGRRIMWLSAYIGILSPTAGLIASVLAGLSDAVWYGATGAVAAIMAVAVIACSARGGTDA